MAKWIFAAILILCLTPLQAASLQSPTELIELRSRELPAYKGTRPTNLPVVAWSPDGRFIAVGGEQVWIYEAETLEEAAVLSSEAAGALNLAWSPGSTLLAVADVEAGVLIWSPFDAAVVRRFTQHDSAVYALDWRPDGEAIASGGVDGMVMIWNPLTGEVLNTFDTRFEEPVPPSLTSVVESLSWNPDGTHLLAATGQGRAAIFSMDGSFQLVESGEFPVIITFADWSPDGEQVALRYPATINDAAAGQVIREYDAPGTQLYIAWSPAGDLLAGSTTGGQVAIWDVSTGSALTSIREDYGEYYGHPLPYANTIAWRPDGSEIASVDNGLSLRIWDTASLGK